jgi:hypothetical protein
MAIKISGTTVIDDSRSLININSGLGVGIQSSSSVIGYGATILNFIGAGNTFKITGSTVDISIEGGGGGGGSIATTGVSTAAFWSNPSFISTSFTLTDGNNNYGAYGPVVVAAGHTITVGLANTLVII